MKSGESRPSNRSEDEHTPVETNAHSRSLHHPGDPAPIRDCAGRADVRPDYPFIIEQAEQLIQKNVAWPTILRAVWTLVPATVGLTIPMALLLAVLMAFGRLSGDREIVVFMACGVSPYRLLKPVFKGCVVATATLWIMIEAIPNANQTYREIIARVVADRAEGKKARVFFEDFPNTVLYVEDSSDRRLEGRPGGRHEESRSADHLCRSPRPDGRRSTSPHDRHGAGGRRRHTTKSADPPWSTRSRASPIKECR